LCCRTNARRARWTQIASRFQSSFLTIDVDLLADGSRRIVETGDGQVSGLPIGMDPARFYASLWNKCPGC
jgi:hypothetical protein